MGPFESSRDWDEFWRSPRGKNIDAAYRESDKGICFITNTEVQWEFSQFMKERTMNTDNQFIC